MKRHFLGTTTAVAVTAVPRFHGGLIFGVVKFRRDTLHVEVEMGWGLGF